MNSPAAFTQTIARRLLLWGAISTIGGVLLHFTRQPFWIGVGQQAIGWGAIDALIALFAGRASAKPFSGRTLRRILLFNAGLDVLYVLGGLILARTRGATDDNRLLTRDLHANLLVRSDTKLARRPRAGVRECVRLAAAVRVEDATQRAQGVAAGAMVDVHASSPGFDQSGAPQLAQVMADG